ncbi:hypothetical protein niasHT_010843 [Heterodera trifolii]|uniref:Latrophilin Cirl n=1 Tax=Heterodera trifolii TaxID=157864 RepID=A0ABD2LEF7_9BILA
MLRYSAFLFGILFCIMSSICPPIWSNEINRTIVVCEGGLASLHCPAQHGIVIHEANFGRFTLLECNPNRLTNITDQCANNRTKELMQASCQRKQACLVKASVEVFGDKCPGDSKYLETTYQCVPAKVTTTTSTTTVSTIASFAENLTENVPKIAAGYGIVMPNGHNYDKIILGCPELHEHELSWPLTAYGQTAQVACPPGTYGHAEWHCSAKTKRWNMEDGPNLAKCTSEWARDLRREHKDDETGSATSQERRDTLLDTLRDIYAKVRQAERLYGGDVKVVAKLLADVAEKERKQAFGKEMLERPHQQEKRTNVQQHMQELVRLIIETTGHLLRTNQRSAWIDLNIVQRRELANQLLHTVPQALSLMLPLLGWSKSGSSETVLAEPTLKCEVTQAKIYDIVPFPSMSLYRQDFDTVQLPRQALQVYDHDLANVFYMAWDHSMGNFLLGTTDQENNNGITIEHRHHHYHVHQHHNMKRHRPVQTRAIARLVGFAVVPLNGRLFGPRHHPLLHQPILIIFQNDHPALMLRHRKIIGEPRCVWWDPESTRFVDTTTELQHPEPMLSANLPYTSAANADGGCTLQERNRTHTVCKCWRMNTHVTVVADFEDRGNAAAFDAWDGKLPFSSPYVYALFRLGALIASICLLISLLITFLIRPSRSKGELIKFGVFPGHPSWHRCHITVHLLLIQLILLNTFYAIQQYQFFCTSIALLLQYFVLASLCWTLLDAWQLRNTALHLHDNTIDTISSNSLLKHISLYLFGYGFPLLLIVVTFFMQNLHKIVPSQPQPLSEFCWLNLDFFGIYTFVGPVSLLLSATVFCLAHTFFAMNSSLRNTKSCSSDAYPYAATTTNGIKMQHKQREQRRHRVHLRQRVHWACTRCALTCTACSAAFCWAYFVAIEVQDGTNDDAATSAFVLNSALALSLLNTALGVQLLAEIVVDKMTRAHYRRWRLDGAGFGPISAFFTAIIDKICCCGTFILKKNSQNGIGAEFPQLKFAFSPSGAVLLENVNGCGPNSSANSSSSSGRNGGTTSACSEVSTTELPASSSGDTALLGQQNQPPPPPAALLQLYHEHKRMNSGSSSTNPKSNDQTSPENANYDYATIPYDELSHHTTQPSAFHGYRMYQPAQSPMYGMTPRQQLPHKLMYAGGNYSARGYLGNNYGGHSPYTYTPQIVRMQQNNQVQLIHPDLPIQPDGINYPHHYHHKVPPVDEHHQPMVMVMDMPTGQMDPNSVFHSQISPPPSAPGFYAPNSSAVHFRHSSPFYGGNPSMAQPSARSSISNGGGTLVLKMDLSRPEPVFSERIDSLEEDGEEEEEQQDGSGEEEEDYEDEHQQADEDGRN